MLRKHRRLAAAVLAVIFTLLLGVTGTAVGLYRAQRAAHESRVAAEREAKAKTTAEQREAETAAVLGFVEQQIFAAARPEAVGGLGRDTTILQAMDYALPFVRDSFPDQPLVEAKLLCSIGASYYMANEPATAEPLFRRSSELFQKQLGNSHSDTLNAVSGIVLCLRDQGKNDEAVALARASVTKATRAHGPDNPATLVATSNLAHLLNYSGRPSDAITLARDLLRRHEAIYGLDDERSLEQLRLLADYLNTQGDYLSVLQLRKELLQRRRRVNGLGHFKTVSVEFEAALEMIAALKVGLRLAEDETPEKAMQMLEDAVDKLQRALGPKHLYVAWVKMRLEGVYLLFNRPNDAVRIGREAAAAYEDQLGAPNPTTLICQVDLAESLIAAGQASEARELLDRIAPDLRAVQLTIPSAVRRGVLLQAEAVRKSGDPSRADALFVEFVNDSLASWDENSVDPAGWASRGDLQARNGRWEDAIKSYAKSLELEPNQAWAAAQFAHLLALTNDRESYHRLCEEIVARFSGDQTSVNAERTAKACLLLGDAGVDLAPVIAEAEKTAKEGDEHVFARFFYFTRGLAQYRVGNYERAIELADRSLDSEGYLGVAPSAACLLKAMSLYRQGNARQGEAAFEAARGTIREQGIASLNDADLGASWHDHVMVRLLERECEALSSQEARGAK